MERLPLDSSSLHPRNWIVAVAGIAAVVGLLVLGNHTSETERAEQTAGAPPAENTGSGADTATQTAPAESTRGPDGATPSGQPDNPETQK